MARPSKQGLDYFPFDVDFFNDDKIQLIEAEFGIKGIYIAIRLLTKIYSEGYYYEWSADKCLLFTKNIGAEGVSNGLVNEVVDGLIRRGIFNDSVFSQFNILTSTGIQKRFINAISRRLVIPIIKEIWLIPIPKNINVDIYLINDDIYLINDDINSQSKVKESKGKKSKNNISSNEDINIGGEENLKFPENEKPIIETLLEKEKEKEKIPPKRKQFTKPTIDEIVDYCDERNNNIDALAFWNFYESKNWMVGKNKMHNWKSAVITWESNERRTPNKNQPASTSIRERRSTELMGGRIL